MATPPSTAYPPARQTQQEPQQPKSHLPPPPTGQNIAPVGAFPGSLTPGWNDPPPLSDNSRSCKVDMRSRPRLDLRKRVAHPLDGQPGQVLASVHPWPLSDPISPRPVAMVQPHRQVITDPNACLDQAAGSSSGPSVKPPESGHRGPEGSAISAAASLPAAAIQGASASKVPVAVVTPRSK